MIERRKESEVKIWIFFVLFLLYNIISGVIFCFTSGGWTVLSVLSFVGNGYLLITVIVFIRILILQISNRRYISIPKRKLCILAVLQILAILFNYGDCGDTSGSYSFFERILGINGWTACKEPLLGVLAIPISISFFTIYFLFLIYVLFLILLFKARKTESKT